MSGVLSLGTERGVDLPVPDWARVFDVAPAPFLLLTPDLVIVHANRARLAATATTLADTVGRHLFDAFPMPPDDPAADGLRNLRATLEEARDTRRPVVMPIQKYDIPLPDGTWAERYWSPVHVPVLDDDGRVVLLLHRSDDITDYVRRQDEARSAADREHRRVADVEGDLFSRTRELAAANAELRQLGERQRRTARSLATLAATVSALAGAETREELLVRLTGHGRAVSGTDAVLLAVTGPRDGQLRLTGPGRPAGRALDPEGDHPAAVAARGRTVVVPDAGDRPPPGPGLRAWAALPIATGGGPLGSLTVGWRTPRRRRDAAPGDHAAALHRRPRRAPGRRPRRRAGAAARRGRGPRGPAGEVCDAVLARLAPDRADDVALLGLRVLPAG